MKWPLRMAVHLCFTVPCGCLAWPKPSRTSIFVGYAKSILRGTPSAALFLVSASLVHNLWRWSGLIWLDVLSWATRGVCLVLQGAPQRLSPADADTAAQSCQ
ncbi:hypothetical protein BDN67DRAFT_967945 [Paxillus ammoniavirescens]|nr:hypothetical protein BDN67DRAFT_967945 [Paxillus ammoniavirescens]